jgi:hypothetical protein
MESAFLKIENEKDRYAAITVMPVVREINSFKPLAGGGRLSSMAAVALAVPIGSREGRPVRRP